MDGNFGGLFVANFTDHYNIRVLPQNGTQPGGESYSRQRINLGLINIFYIVFYRVFYGYYVNLRPI